MKSLGSPIAVAVAGLVKKARRAANFTQTQLADQLHWDKAKIILIEKNQQQVKLAEFVAIFETLGMDPPKVLREAMKLRTEKASQKKGRP